MAVDLKKMTLTELDKYADAQMTGVESYRKLIEDKLAKWAYIKAEARYRRERLIELQRRWAFKLTNKINKKRLYKDDNVVHIYYKTEPTFSETKEFKWADYTPLVSFWVADDVKLDDIYHLMQGEVWSPEGEARELIEMLGLKHTSMSIGDLIDMPDHALLEVAQVGFKPVGRPKD